MRRIVMVAALAAPWVVASSGRAQPAGPVGIEERLGETVPLESFFFTDESGARVCLKDLFDRPIVLTPVYYRCPSICTPLLQEVARNVDLCDLSPGRDYRVVTFSFNPDETSELARTKKKNIVGLVKAKPVPEDAWRFLTGDPDNIRRITDAIGFRYARDSNQADFIHAPTVVLLSPQGKIVRYLSGLRFNPADLKMVVLDASEGRPRSLVQQVQQICYAYDPKTRSYVLRINRIILAVTVVCVVVFAVFLLVRGIRRPSVCRPPEAPPT